MTAVPVQERMTAEQFLAMPERRDARIRELVAGELVVNEPTLRHNVVSVNLIRALDGWIRSGEARGRVVIPLDVKLDDRNVFVPDISWYSASRSPHPDSLPPYPRPDLAIEIRSPGTWRYDIGVKKSVYERRGLSELWLVDMIAEQVLVFRRSGPKADVFDVALELDRGRTVESPLLPGFALKLDELFELG